ncbi:ABC transporter substrate-binding protein [Mycolicibacterium sp. BiH015]|uniref:ABC transporter substrate-binding protein n=1 Tax=Mycolicibacterium sp. BiH015 TaxID=3018808 RepID=UPI0022E40AAB|nr:ABC transporter substrate-binding protein [Mycolicibacterium sp. BiH015]MDA2892116.1 ABC transporter substrate-binding protein [Mycolicibacterium sp. BiH015]
MKSKRLLSLFGIGVAVATMLSGCGSNESSSGEGSSAAAMPTSEAEINGDIDTSKVKKKIVVAVDNPYYLFHHDVLVAQDKGYFSEVGIDEVEIVTVEDPLPALIGGSVDFALYDTDTTIAAAAKSKSGVRYLSVYLGGEANILGVREGIENAEDLKGTTITGGQFGSRNDFLIRKLLTDNGINPDTDVTLVSTGGQSNERLQSVIAGTVDGASLQLRHRALLEAEGGKFLFEELGQVPQNGWSANKILTESPETAAAFLVATLKARQFITDVNNKDAVLDLMASKGFELPQEYRDAYAAEQAPDYHTSDGGFDVSDMNQFIDEQIELKVIPPGTNWREYVDLIPLWRAQKNLGLPLRPALSEMDQ